jgi:hypothetical protein
LGGCGHSDCDGGGGWVAVAVAVSVVEVVEAVVVESMKLKYCIFSLPVFLK